MNGILTKILEETIEEATKSIGKSAAIGGASDGAIAVANRKGVKGVLKDIGCGVFTGASGASATVLFRHFTKNTGPVGMLVGVGASVGARYVYRRAMGDLPSQQEAKEGEEPLEAILKRIFERE